MDPDILLGCEIEEVEFGMEGCEFCEVEGVVRLGKRMRRWGWVGYRL